MATTTQPTNHPLTPKLWAKKLFYETIAQTYFGQYMGSTTDAMVYVRDELRKEAGDKVTYGLRAKLSGRGITGDGMREGEEEPMSFFSDSILIDQLSNQVRSEGKMSEQRQVFNFQTEAKNALRDWWSERLDVSMFNQLAGNTAQTDLAYTGFNATIAPDTNHIIRLDGTTTAGSLSTTNVMTLNVIDRCIERANTISPLVRPFKVNGTDMWVLFIHDYQVYDLETSTSTGGWLDIQKAALTSGNQFKDNPLFSGALGIYKNVIIKRSTYIPYGSDTTTARTSTRTAIFAGSQALCFARAGEGGEQMNWREEQFNFKTQWGISADMIFGIKKCRFNSADFGVIVCPTYAVAH